ncbi:unnamed protein product [Miscanthus lutarioriparius]|uniref:Uncharacterized protein n=1 Tax=Miscanthus lutarioriparius TaxID=422564 RepID=A0A811PSV2_9POAL|nr:unnamed protein product [Miscanthus lutarioriparius]
MSPILQMQKFYPVADVTSLGAAAGSHCYSEEEAASTVTHEPMEDLPAEAVPKAPSTEDDTVTDGQGAMMEIEAAISTITPSASATTAQFIRNLQEMFEREIGRLRTLFPQQQQQQHVAFGSLSFTELAAPFIPLFVVVSSIKRGAALMNREFHPIVKKAGEVNDCGSGP